MDENWWPDLLAHIPKETPWDSAQYVAAELRSFADPWLPGERTTFSALIGAEDLKGLDGQLIHFNYRVEASGPRPGIWAKGNYRPSFWISAGADYRLKCEPLVLEWVSNNRNALAIDPGFLMTYGLIPRALEDGSIHYDDPAVPEFDVAIVDPPSVYDDSAHSGARVLILRDHVQDYLTLRGIALVEVYYEIRRGPADAAIDALLEGKKGLTFKLSDREFQVQRRPEGGFVAQVWGARVVAQPADLPVSADPLDAEGLKWPNFADPVTNETARRLGIGDYAYVSDSVLDAYEGRPGFRVHPESGGVSYGNQWHVGFCDRVGRDVIRLELKKLYEGAGHRVVQHWHQHALNPTKELLNPEGRVAPNVGSRSRKLVNGLTTLGLRLAELSILLGIVEVSAEQFVGLDRADLDYQGWWNGPNVEPVTRHYPLALSREGFLARCIALNKLLIEPLSEARLRKMAHTIGVPAADMKEFGALKLLDRIVCLAQVSVASGLSLWDAGAELVARLKADGTEPVRPLDHLFALSDMRNIAAHRKPDADNKLDVALRRFGIEPAAVAGGYGEALDALYDRLGEQLTVVGSTLERAIHV
jgi:hypothetical protein